LETERIYVHLRVKHKNMKQIYLQTTVDYIFSVDPNLLKILEALGEPKVKEIIDSKGEKIKYYVFECN
jgi:hypothetical protein